ncbi:MAG: ATP synthase F1 subunit epsilon [Prevotellaceae bacterium]|nr:ATP synthase F1 subunit epsilon [Prevotellaceae bacterium]
MQLQIVSPEKELFSGEVESITLPGTAGEFSLLPNHAPIVSSLKAGQLFYLPKGGSDVQTVAISGGFVEQHNNKVSACVELADAIKITDEKKA